MYPFDHPELEPQQTTPTLGSRTATFRWLLPRFRQRRLRRTAYELSPHFEPLPSEV